MTVQDVFKLPRRYYVYTRENYTNKDLGANEDMDGQINIYNFLSEKPPIGSIIYFITCEKIKKAEVINHDASFAGFPYEGYIKAMTKNEEVWRIKAYYNSLKEAKKHLLEE